MKVILIVLDSVGVGEAPDAPHAVHREPYRRTEIADGAIQGVGVVDGGIVEQVGVQLRSRGHANPSHALLRVQAQPSEDDSKCSGAGAEVRCQINRRFLDDVGRRSPRAPHPPSRLA